MPMQHCLERDIREIAATIGDDVKQFAGRTILVCGGAGFLGRYFTTLLTYLNDQLLSRPCQIIVCDNYVIQAAGRPLKLFWKFYVKKQGFRDRGCTAWYSRCSLRGCTS